MERVIIESPLRGEYALNKTYLLLAMRDSLLRGEAPFASHLLYPEVLNDRILSDRELGLRAGFAWAYVADKIVVYEDRGLTEGMKLGLDQHEANDKKITFRRLPKGVLTDAIS